MYRKRERGNVAIMIGLALPIIIGMVALGTEITYVLFKHRQMQSTADAAALGAATALQSGHPTPTIQARGIASYLGFVNGAADGTVVTVNNPPVSGPQAGSNAAVEVLVSQPQTLSLVTYFYSGAFNVGARAVAIIGTGNYCVLQLGTGGTVSMSNGAIANLTQCGLAVDGTGSPALSLVGGATVNSPMVSVAGTASMSNGGAVSPTSALKTGQANVADPYAGVVMPTFSGCGQGTSKSYGGGTWTLNPGVYCNGISFNNAGTSTMNAGVYFIDRGYFAVSGGSKVTGTGVTIVLTSSTGSGYASVSIDNGTTVTLTAPTTGTTAGIVFFGDRRATSAVSNTLAGGTTLSITGAIYLPTETLTWNNGASNTSSTCTELIAGTITLGGANFQINCPGGVAAIGASNSSLVE